MTAIDKAKGLSPEVKAKGKEGELKSAKLKPTN